MKNIVIIGAGGVGKEVALIIEQINNFKQEWNILGYLDDNTNLHGKEINGYKVLGGIDYAQNLDKNIYVICGVANYKFKKFAVEKLTKLGFTFANIIHPSVYISNTNSIGEGVIIYPEVIMTTNVRIGNQVIISPKCGIGHEAVIEDYCSLLWNVNVSGNVSIGEGCLVGSGATIIQGLNIGENVIVGAGAVVIKDIPNNYTVVGSPAKPIKLNNI